ncbi:PC-esterase domain-containing protein 1B [Suricata suricatta]|uniref:PC-esterase domain containing 1B n=1 Tax=Suricata suricatta TaxID=37032 RepID=A0A673UAH1_SURSU|nr:PC-esterase domain-containing protein 1B [Suricata suricatta]XP_029810592.1 PC-esterase domain-containing protein 1B [Suricata suricatta]XP_029810593.1 PC-esterase domain-containing protein 1B [Suricata suricatta]XP_029810594.1 PC-esterase domain-containing protein 1B [Suricata suricatta]XP_029810595.1 PC-esterase domain-containing protein 1B [Suricata suricatta]
MVHLLASEVQQLLHNKFVVILGDSVQRAVYKDLVLLLQKDLLLTPTQLKAKGEESFEQDTLVDGGQRGPMHNGTQYREVRQFCSDHHLVRFYFLTRVYSNYLEAILHELQSSKHGPPDLIIMNSCLWDLSRYGPDSWKSYLENLESLFERLGQVLPESCLLVWNTAMPVGKQITAGFLPPEHRHGDSSLRNTVIAANFHSSVEAKKHGFDVLDLHFHFRHAGCHLQRDGVHWDQRAHRHLSQLLLAHVADAWGVDLPQRNPVSSWIQDGPARTGPDQGIERRPQASPEEPSLRPSGYRPLLPLPHRPRPPHPFQPIFPHRRPFPFGQVMTRFLFCPQDNDFASDHHFQSDQFSSNYFHSDFPLPAEIGFSFEEDLQPPMPPFPTPYLQRPPVVHRGFPRYVPRGPYVPWGRRPRYSKRRALSHPQPRPQ